MNGSGIIAREAAAPVEVNELAMMATTVWCQDLGAAPTLTWSVDGLG